jgi:hypothetical protein
MSNELTNPEDDGFNGASIKNFRGGYLRWSASTHWTDRDGLPPPSPMLVIAIDEVLKQWKDGKPEIISEKPLPDPDALNSAIPMKEWEIGIDGKPRPPWAHTVVFYLIDPLTGGLYIYSASTVGAHMAFDALREAVVVMRSLRGARVMPLVALGERPMKTRFGQTTRPHFQVLDWKSPGGGDNTALADQTTPQLLSPVAAALSTPAAAPATAAAPWTSTAASPTTSMPAQPAKPTINLTANKTLSAIGNPKPVTPNEFFNDEIPF